MTRADKTNTANRPLPAVFAAVLLLGGSPARAEESCTLRGEAVIPKGVAISDSGGADIAQFTGAKIPVSVSGFSVGGGGRAKIQTTGFRVEGYVRSREIPVYTVRSVAAYAGHVWIAEGRRVSVIGGGPGKLQVERSVTSPLNGVFRGWASCESFSLTERVPSGWTPPGYARGYVMRRERIDLYSSERGEVVTALERGGDGAGVLLWSSEGAASGGWVHVEHHSDIVLDGWVRTSDVSALPPGETMDQLAPSPVQRGSPVLNVQGQPRIVRVDKPVSLRAAASDAAGTIGGIDSGVEVMVLDIVAGWASVLPKALNISPAGSTQFWVRAKDLGL
jgi:hypothetical protein